MSFTFQNRALSGSGGLCVSRICLARPYRWIYSVHGAIAEHYKMNPAMLTESHSSTIDYVISATAG